MQHIYANGLSASYAKDANEFNEKKSIISFNVRHFMNPSVPIPLVINQSELLLNLRKVY